MPLEKILADIEHKLKIQFDGLDAANHEIELFSLGESLKGLARIASVVGNFATTEKYSKRFSCHDVRVVAREPKANCFSFEILWSFVQQHQILSGSFGAVVSALIPYILARTANKREEMNILKKILSINNIFYEKSSYIGYYGTRRFIFGRTFTGERLPGNWYGKSKK